MSEASKVEAQVEEEAQELAGIRDGVIHGMEALIVEVEARMEVEASPLKEELEASLVEKYGQGLPPAWTITASDRKLEPRPTPPPASNF